MAPTAQYKQCPQCKQLAPLQAPACSHCGRQFRTQFGSPPPPPDQTRVFSGPPPGAQVIPPAYSQSPYASTVTDRCAVLSAVIGGLSLAFLYRFGWLFSIVSIVLGVISLGRIRANPQLSGRGMAILGTALSVPALIWAAYSATSWVGTVAQAGGTTSPAYQPTPGQVVSPDVEHPTEPNLIAAPRPKPRREVPVISAHTPHPAPATLKPAPVALVAAKKTAPTRRKPAAHENMPCGHARADHGGAQAAIGVCERGEMFQRSEGRWVPVGMHLQEQRPATDSVPPPDFTPISPGGRVYVGPVEKVPTRKGSRYRTLPALPSHPPTP